MALAGVIAALAGLLVLSALDVGFRLFVVSSGSMSPAVTTGSLAVVRRSGAYGVGDVITFREPVGSGYITHRIVEVTREGGAVFFVTKGDANESPDLEPVIPDMVDGRVVFHVPRLGYLVSFLRTGPGLTMMLAASGVAVWLFVMEKPPGKERGRRRSA